MHQGAKADSNVHALVWIVIRLCEQDTMKSIGGPITMEPPYAVCGFTAANGLNEWGSNISPNTTLYGLFPFSEDAQGGFTINHFEQMGTKQCVPLFCDAFIQGVREHREHSRPQWQ